MAAASPKQIRTAQRLGLPRLVPLFPAHSRAPCAGRFMVSMYEKIKTELSMNRIKSQGTDANGLPLLAVVAGGKAGFFSENLGKMAGCGVADFEGNIDDALFRLAKQPPRKIDAKIDVIVGG